MGDWNAVTAAIHQLTSRIEGLQAAVDQVERAPAVTAALQQLTTVVSPTQPEFRCGLDDEVLATGPDDDERLETDFHPPTEVAAVAVMGRTTTCVLVVGDDVRRAAATLRAAMTQRAVMHTALIARTTTHTGDEVVDVMNGENGESMSGTENKGGGDTNAGHGARA
ncbi:uncharacterized protein IUM83_17200 [Phytophthora cinnamomi]|uniref:uncharacterized protein n=1 Tax=Phytophthora cinnamomi TaxID=4785 RepID=UPI00355ACC6C|nr:hypothetical protein IUM83_17200 [Phytophthora cinnamomi]